MTLAVVVATETVTDGGSIVAAPTAALNRPVHGPAAGGVPAAGPGTGTLTATPTVLDRLLEQLASLDITDCRIIARGESAPALRAGGHEVIESADLAGDLREISRLVRGARRPVLLLHGDIVSHTEQLARLVMSNKAAATAVVARGRADGSAPVRPLVRVEGGRVVSAGSPFHQVTDPNGVFLGVLWVSARETRRSAALAAELAGLVETPGALPETGPLRSLTQGPETGHETAGHETTQEIGHESAARAEARDPALIAELRRLRVTPVTGADAPALLLVALVRSGVPVTVRRTSTLRCERVLTQDEADAAHRVVGMVDEDEARLSAAVKSNDGFFTTFAVSTYSRYIARWAARRGLTPNMVTSFSMALSVVAAVGFAAGNRAGMVLGAVFLYFAFVFDCVDGQLARYSRRFSTLGAWLDATFDRAKEYIAFAGLAVGSTAAAVSSSVHSGDVWALAIAAMIVQTCRHMVDFSFGAARRRTPGPVVPVVPLLPLTDPGDSRPAAGSGGGPSRGGGPDRGGGGAARLVMTLSAYTDRFRGTHWAKKIIVLPIGERFALISLTAAFGNARVTFIALLSWGSVAFLYTATGRFLRSLSQ